MGWDWIGWSKYKYIAKQNKQEANKQASKQTNKQMETECKHNIVREKCVVCVLGGNKIW